MVRRWIVAAGRADRLRGADQVFWSDWLVLLATEIAVVQTCAAVTGSGAAPLVSGGEPVGSGVG
ncbi:hypothetical protein [Nocardia amikacinitolerans]|uniref:hypothetical protein n=1 Tax=Nocardia amikacinitolerans TaxID=756689 RepID=UPI000BE24C32|nr:hypothetical protein [Nocardia amikacinitolerans]